MNKCQKYHCDKDICDIEVVYLTTQELLGGDIIPPFGYVDGTSGTFLERKWGSKEPMIYINKEKTIMYIVNDKR